jgi:hypothetical protein
MAVMVSGFGLAGIAACSFEVNTDGPLKKMFQIASSIFLAFLKIEVLMRKE